MPYKLSASLHAHSSDVRAVASPSDTIVLSASRDTTAVSWSRPAPTAPFVREAAFQAGSKYVNAVAYIPPTSDAPKGFVVTGGADTVINVYNLSTLSSEPKYSLLGHRENVCALHTTANGLIISGSWDRTAKVWINFQEKYELVGHEQSVWAVLAVDDATFLTGSADNSIKLWKQHKLINTFTGHTSAVRDLALVPDLGFASCSNDCEIRVWTTEGDVVYTLNGHTSFVYSITVLPDGSIASGAEDRTVRLWRDGECVQTIVHPAISVWSVSSMPNGDIVSGSSDGVVRVFSASEDRWATAEELKHYDEQVASQALPSQQVGDVKKTDLPSHEALQTPGKKEGEVKMINVNGNVEAHQWDSAAGRWQKIGDVVDAVGSNRKQLHQGKEYDYVFDVDIKDGAPPLKLPYNANENPYSAAQRFLAANDLPMTYVDEVVQFIEKNTGGVNLSTSNEFVDPYTGGSRYRAEQAPTPSAASAVYNDPFTGGSRYTPASANMPPQPPAASVTHKATVIPVSTFLSFKQANVPAMRGKIMQLDEAFQNEISAAGTAMDPQESILMDDILIYLTEVSSTGAGNRPAKLLNSSHIQTIVQILDRWPSSSRFPVVDVARLVIGFCPSSYADPLIASGFFRSILRAADWSEPWEVPLSKARETNILLALRAISNAFQESTVVIGLEWVGEILAQLSKAPYEVLTKTQRLALATIIFNISCVRLKSNLGDKNSNLHFELISMALAGEKTDAETAYRALVALGNSLLSLKTQGGQLTHGQIADFREVVSLAKTRFPEERVVTVSKDVENLL